MSSPLVALQLSKLVIGPRRGADGSSDDDAINTEERIWDLTQSINVKGVWFGCKHAIIAMRKVCQHDTTTTSRRLADW